VALAKPNGHLGYCLPAGLHSSYFIIIFYKSPVPFGCGKDALTFGGGLFVTQTNSYSTFHFMNIKLTQTEFDVMATAWTAFIDSANPNQMQNLFQLLPLESAKSAKYQTFVSFDLTDTITQLLSTVGIRQVMARFVLMPNTPAGTPRFRIVLYAADERGGRISAYYQGDSDYHDVPPSTEATDLQDPAAPQGQVPFSLISNWLKAWCRATTLSLAIL
jgi:hypothetical protein